MHLENISKKINILVVDDDVNLCANLTDILSEDGYEITSFNSVAQAKEELKQKDYNLIITDLKLPDGLGFELFMEARKNRYGDTNYRPDWVCFAGKLNSRFK